jgi:hypothetical protein
MNSWLVLLFVIVGITVVLNLLFLIFNIGAAIWYIRKGLSHLSREEIAQQVSVPGLLRGDFISTILSLQPFIAWYFYLPRSLWRRIRGKKEPPFYSIAMQALWRLILGR